MAFVHAFYACCLWRKLWVQILEAKFVNHEVCFGIYGYVWQYGSGYFSNNFSCWNACQWYFFIFLKLFLTSAHQNDLKSINCIKF